jgi:hypothetical protein
VRLNSSGKVLIVERKASMEPKSSLHVAGKALSVHSDWKENLPVRSCVSKPSALTLSNVVRKARKDRQASFA